ncbi:uncharacterized protein LOC115720192 [Cannabis sativa]|uniref:uncharacterized protein LOC115720192 n=1 Tax=Cannabis sativa TaxID=3483 RepID=UPI0011DFAEBC|nr:uncharacterized protein LOC115720192 [Cannabis sativa]
MLYHPGKANVVADTLSRKCQTGGSLYMEMVDRYVNDRGDNDDEDMLLLDDDEGDLSGIDDRWCLVGRFLTKQNVDFQVIDGSPWTFDRAPLIFERLKQGENPRMVPLNRLDFWVQLHNLESGFMTESTVRNVVNHVGTFLKSDPNYFVGVWRDFLRVRVKLNIDKPLKKKMKLEKKSGKSSSLIFKYEDLPTFCFICGVLGHSERFCEKLFDTPPELIVKEYDLSLKAAPRRRQHTKGSQWL